jgi:hypothetical protein
MIRLDSLRERSHDSARVKAYQQKDPRVAVFCELRVQVEILAFSTAASEESSRSDQPVVLCFLDAS